MVSNRIALASVFGGLTLFVWGAVSHSLLPLYNNALQRFADQDAVAAAVSANAPQTGTYFLPNYPNYPEGATPEERKALDEEMSRQMAKGPTVFAHVRVGAMDHFGAMMMRELFTNIVAAFFAALLFLNATQISFARKVLFAACIGAILSFDHSASAWTWYGAGGSFFLAESVDAIVGWTLAGIVIATTLGKGEKQEEKA
jgi:hypothetical protein